jgi:hypothetical protein
VAVTTTRWRYFLSFGIGAGDQLDAEQQVVAADAGRAGMTRLPVGARVALAESLRGREGRWWASDLMWRAKYLGSDYEFTEVSAERAQELLERWVRIGRLERMPSQETTITPELAQHLTRIDAEAEARWRDVPTPPGAEDIRP